MAYRQLLIVHGAEKAAKMTGIELKALRQQADMTQEELGRKLGKNRDTIRRYERQDTIPEMVELAVRVLIG